jgi:hypothetical protein
MIALPMVSGVLALLIGPPAAQEEKASHYGIYEYVKGMRGDQEVPEENLKGRKVEIEEGELELIGPDGTDEFEIKVTMDGEPSEEGVVKFSMEITESSLFQEAVGSKAKALGKHEDDTITVIYDFAEGADYPDDFEPDGPTQHMFVIKKVADAEDEGEDDDEDDDDDDDDPDA